MNIYTFVQTWLAAKEQTAEERGAGLAEYALLLALIAILAIPAIQALQGAISATYNAVAAAL